MYIDRRLRQRGVPAIHALAQSQQWLYAANTVADTALHELTTFGAIGESK